MTTTTGSIPTTHVVARSSWERAYASRVAAVDLIIVIVSVFLTQIIWWGSYEESDVVVASMSNDLRIDYPIFSVVLILSWLVALKACGSRDIRVLGNGSIEFRRVVMGTLFIFGAFGIVSYLFKLELGRGYLLTALPIGLALLIIGRVVLRAWLTKQRRSNDFVYRTVLVGDVNKTRHVAKRVMNDARSGFHVIGLMTPEGSNGDTVEGIPVIGDFTQVARQAARLGADTVAICGSDALTPQIMRQLGWELDGRGINMIVAPTLTDVAGPRIHMRPVAGLPLIHVEYPELGGRKRFEKRIFDLVGSALLIVASSPVMLAVAIAVKATSRGPIFYHQERIGHRGKPFRMLKFRSMRPDADGELASLLDAQGTSEQPLFKVLNDPRITPVGRVIRKYSLDEFPQLFNVFAGSMSLVGPRPQRAAEVALYDRWAHRRHLVKPGMSGLWQVSGRSQLSWEDAISLDLYYVENWSTVNDLVILMKTVRAVVAPGKDAH